MAELRQSAIIAAEWWTKKISSPIPEDLCNSDCIGAGSAKYMKQLYCKFRKYAASKKQLKEFQDSLAQHIDDELNHKNELCLECCCGPCSFLAEIATPIGINLFIFPHMRSMWITSDSVDVIDGFDAPLRQIYNRKEKNNT